MIKKVEFARKAEMRQKCFTTRRLLPEAFAWNALVMHAASLNCYCSKNKMSSCVSCVSYIGLGVCDNENGRKKGKHRETV